MALVFSLSTRCRSARLPVSMNVMKIGQCVAPLGSGVSRTPRQLLMVYLSVRSFRSGRGGDPARVVWVSWQFIIIDKCTCRYPNLSQLRDSRPKLPLLSQLRASGLKPRGGYSSSSRAGRLGRTLWPQNSTSVAETEKGGQNSTMTPPPPPQR